MLKSLEYASGRKAEIILYSRDNSKVFMSRDEDELQPKHGSWTVYIEDLQ